MGATWLKNDTQKISALQTHKSALATTLKFYIVITTGKSAKIWFGHNFWLKGPIDQRPTRLNCILQDLFKDTPLDHIWCAQICTLICIFDIYSHQPTEFSKFVTNVIFSTADARTMLTAKKWKKCEQCKQFIHISDNILFEMEMMKLQNREQTLKQTGTSVWRLCWRHISCLMTNNI